MWCFPCKQSKLLTTEIIIINVFTLVPLLTDEGVYVNNSGSLVKHAVMQWGETPYAVGKAILRVQAM